MAIFSAQTARLSTQLLLRVVTGYGKSTFNKLYVVFAIESGFYEWKNLCWLKSLLYPSMISILTDPEEILSVAYMSGFS